MMAAEVEDGGGGQRWRRMTTMATADDDSGEQRQRRMMKAREIRWRTMWGKEESRRRAVPGQPALSTLLGLTCLRKKRMVWVLIIEKL